MLGGRPQKCARCVPAGGLPEGYGENNDAMIPRAPSRLLSASVTKGTEKALSHVNGSTARKAARGVIVEPTRLPWRTGNAANASLLRKARESHHRLSPAADAGRGNRSGWRYRRRSVESVRSGHDRGDGAAIPSPTSPGAMLPRCSGETHRRTPLISTHRLYSLWPPGDRWARAIVPNCLTWRPPVAARNQRTSCLSGPPGVAGRYVD